MPGATGSLKRQGANSPPEPPQEAMPWWYFGFGPPYQQNLRELVADRYTLQVILKEVLQKIKFKVTRSTRTNFQVQCFTVLLTVSMMLCNRSLRLFHPAWLIFYTYWMATSHFPSPVSQQSLFTFCFRASLLHMPHVNGTRPCILLWLAFFIHVGTYNWISFFFMAE